jgi:hypothetical protein
MERQLAGKDSAGGWKFLFFFFFFGKDWDCNTD